MMWASKERKGVVKEVANQKATLSYPKCEMNKVLGAHSRLAGGREVVQEYSVLLGVCDWPGIERS